MHRSLSPGRRSSIATALALMVTAAAASSAAAAGVGATNTEQVNRADGVAGAFPLEAATTTDAAITDDGTSAYFTFTAARGAWVNSNGLYRRDLVTNKTTRIAAAPATLTGLTTDGRTVSFVTTQALDATDRNGKPDVYAYDAQTGAISLISRADGVSGVALGVTSTGFVARGGKVAIFGTSIGIGRRDLATGKTVKIGDGNVGWPTPGVFSRADLRASGDGSVFQNDANLFTPTGLRPLTGLDTSQYAQYGNLAVAENGSTAAWQNLGGQSLTLINPTTGAITQRSLLDAGGDYPTQAMSFAGLTPDGSEAFTASFDRDPDVTFGKGEFTSAKRLNLSTGAVSNLGLKTKVGIGALSRTGRFTLVSGGQNSGAIVAKATGAGVLPGTVDAPSPYAYTTYVPGCRLLGYPSSRKPQITVDTFQNAELPKVTTGTIKVYNASGALVNDATGGGSTDLGVQANVGVGAFKVVVTLTLATGATITETSSQPALASNAWCPTSPGW